MTDPFTPPAGDQPAPPPYGTPPAGAPAYGAPAQGPPYGSPYGAPVGKRNGFGTAALVLGILSLVLCWVPVVGLVIGVLAIVFAVLGRKRAGRREADNGGMAIAGLVTGIIGLILSVIFTSILIFLSDEIRCVQEAQNDPAAQAQCEDRLRERLNN